jgi:hypothetical protein
MLEHLQYADNKYSISAVEYAPPIDVLAHYC